jgi:hypothetical protein
VRSVKKTVKLILVAFITLAFSGASFAAETKGDTKKATPATPASPAIEKEKKEEAKDEKGKKVRKKGEGKAKAKGKSEDKKSETK